MKINKFKVIIPIIILLAIIGAIAYIVYANSNKDKPNEIDVKYEKVNMYTDFRLGVSDFDSINPHLTQNKDVIQIDSLIFEPLLSITEDYKIKNCLAVEWSKVSNKSYLLKLKENVEWQNASDFTAEDVKFTVDKIQREKKSVYLENVKDIKQVEVVDSYTVKIELNKEIPFFEYQLIFPIISKKQYENKDMSKSSEIPIGTGRYKIKKIGKDSIKLTKNEEWHGIELENPNIKNITISLFDNMGEVYNSFRLGNIDLVHTNNLNYEKYIGSMGYQKKEYRGREYDYIAFNCENVILENIEVRQAIQKIIDKEKIVATALKGSAYVSNSSLDYGSYLVNDLQLTITKNTKEASKILEEAGWKHENGIWTKKINGKTKTLKFNLTVNKENKQRAKVAKEIKEELEEFGIKITVVELTNNNYQKALENHQYEIALAGIYNGYSPDLSSFLDKNNLANYENDEVQAILNEVTNVTSEELQKEKYKKIIEICQREVPYIGLYRNKVIVAYGQSVKGDVTPNNYSVFYNFNEWYRQ